MHSITFKHVFKSSTFWIDFPRGATYDIVDLDTRFHPIIIGCMSGSNFYRLIYLLSLMSSNGQQLEPHTCLLWRFGGRYPVCLSGFIWRHRITERIWNVRCGKEVLLALVCGAAHTIELSLMSLIILKTLRRHWCRYRKHSFDWIVIFPETLAKLVLNEVNHNTATHCVRFCRMKSVSMNRHVHISSIRPLYHLPQYSTSTASPIFSDTIGGFLSLK